MRGAFAMALAIFAAAPAQAFDSPFSGPVCPQRAGPIFLSGEGVVVGFLTRDQALALRVRMEFQLHAALNPDYLDNPRAVIETSRGDVSGREVALVPEGVTVRVGDRVAFDGAYWDPLSACRYMPNLIRPDAPTG